MQDDNPLWYDYADPDEPPSRTLLAVAALFGATVSAVKGGIWTYWLPDRIWLRGADTLVRYRAARLRRP
jgi:hypothetical protein